MRIRWTVVALVVAGLAAAAARPGRGDAQLNEGYFQGTVTIPGHTIQKVTVSGTAVAADGTEYTAHTQATSATWNLIVEGGVHTWTLKFAVLTAGGGGWSFTRQVSVGVGQTVQVDATTDALVQVSVDVTGETFESFTVVVDNATLTQGSPFYPEGVNLPVAGTSSVSVPVFGGTSDLRVRVSRVKLPHPEGPTTPTSHGPYVDLVPQTVALAVNETKALSFTTTPGYIDATITVNGATVKSVYLGATRTPPGGGPSHGGSVRYDARPLYRLTVPPIAAPFTYQVSGAVELTTGQIVPLAPHGLSVQAGQITTDSWTLSDWAAVEGVVDIQGWQPLQTSVRAFKPGGGSSRSTIFGQGQTTNAPYRLDGLPAGWLGWDWYIQDYVPSNPAFPAYWVGAFWEGFLAAPGSTTTRNLSLKIGRLQGSILAPIDDGLSRLTQTLAGGRALDTGNPAGWKSPAFNMSHSGTVFAPGYGRGEYDFRVPEGSYRVHYLLHFFDEARTGYTGTSNYRVDFRNPDNNHYTFPVQTSVLGQTARADLGYRTGEILVRMRTLSGAPLSYPNVTAESVHQPGDNPTWTSTAGGRTNNASPVQTGVVIVRALAGTYRVTAQARVGNSGVTFGQPTVVTVPPGQQVVVDLVPPQIVVTSPAAGATFGGSTVTVVGQVTDDVQVASLEIDGTTVPFDGGGNFTWPLTGLTQGTHTFVVTATDTSGNTATLSRSFTVVDSAPPTVHSATATPSSLWPVGGNLTSVELTLNVTDDGGGPVVCWITGVTSNEPVTGPGYGNTTPDWIFTGAANDLSLQIRAERAGQGDGRTYTVTVACADHWGNTTTTTIDVVVPHDQGN